MNLSFLNHLQKFVCKKGQKRIADLRLQGFFTEDRGLIGNKHTLIVDLSKKVSEKITLLIQF